MLSWATTTIGTIPHRVDFKMGVHTLTADEPLENGGKDAGPNPLGLLLASLGACTAITLKKRADDAGWPLEALEVDLRFSERAGALHIERILSFAGDLSDVQRNEMLTAADQTPITCLLQSGLRIRTELA